MITDWPDEARNALWAHLRSARWFGGKGGSGELSAVIPLPWYVTPTDVSPGVRSEIAVITYPDQVEHYHLLLAYGDLADNFGAVTLPGHGRVSVGDACTDPRTRRLLWQAMATEQVLTQDATTDGIGAELVIGADDSAAASLDEDVSVFGGEQSNTSLIIGETLIMKLFRKLEPGRNLDIERHRDLADAGNTDIAALHGWVEARWITGDGGTHDVDLAMIIEQFAGVQDGWSLALQMCASGASFAREAGELGAALHRVHQSLAADVDDARISGDALADTLDQQLAEAIAVADVLAPYADGLRQRFAVLRGRTIDVQPVHGDLHLGQVLHSRTGWKIIDFEGEPVKSMAQRRMPASPWRDVAGILRSFSYVAASVDGDEAAARAWAAEASDAFLAGYRPSGCTLAEQDLLTAQIADRAAYEIMYETRNRPDWVHIPLHDVAALAH
ncbi:MAG: phosphotransferase [Propionibacteriales bacterium]|nr:phosphotransferase [Propionibacteriales bacterium]